MVSELKDDELKGTYFLALASVYRSLGDREVGALYETRAMDAFERIKDYGKVAEIQASQISRRHNRLLAEGKREDILAMIPEYQEEIEYSGKYSKYVLSYNTRHLAQIHRRQTGDYQESLRLFKESLSHRQEIRFRPFIPASYSSIGDVYLAMEDLDSAIEAYETSIALAEEIGFIRYEYYPRIQIGDIYLKQGNKEKAEEYYLGALASATFNAYEEGINEANAKVEEARQ